ncbi:MAG: transposase [Firmicutes bacterium]|nr:transposase [Alicyclobacillaceae bacterium]MCL6498090.1 transposase [Bacillota bacterium]
MGIRCRCRECSPIIGRRRACKTLALGQFFSALRYQAQRYGTRSTEVDRWFPKRKQCASPGCGYVNQGLRLRDRTWTCPGGGVTPDRDVNAAIQLQGLAAYAVLPVATWPARAATAPGGPGVGGDVTPVRHEATPLGSVRGFGAGRSRYHSGTPTLSQGGWTPTCSRDCSRE